MIDEATNAAPLFDDISALPVLEMSRDTLDRLKLVGFESADSRSRPFNLLRTQLLKTMAETGARLIGVTSAAPAAGKTFVAANLAAALSRTVRSVILCDLDLRRGSLRNDFEFVSAQGIDDFLAGNVRDPAETVVRINDGKLVVMPTAAVRADSSELLAGKRFATLMARLRASAEHALVICDLPPVFANDDAMLAMNSLDGYLLVVDHGRTSARQVEEALGMLRPAPCLGTVLNRYHGGIGDPYGYGYGYGAYGAGDTARA